MLAPPAADDPERRVLVAFDCDPSLTHAVRPARLTPVLCGGGGSASGSASASAATPAAVVCATTDAYRRLARSQVTAADRVLEVGCSAGACTALLARHAGRGVVGVDNSRELLRAAAARVARCCLERGGASDVRLEHCDVLAAPEELKALAAGCGVVFVDIGGNRQLASLVTLLPWLLAELRPRLLVVKSEALAAEARRRLKAEEEEEQHERQQEEGEGSKEQVASEEAAAAEALGSDETPPGVLRDPRAWWRRLRPGGGGDGGGGPAETAAGAGAGADDDAAAAAGAGAAAAPPPPQLIENPLYFKWKAKDRRGVHPMRFPERCAPGATAKVCRPFNFAECHAGDACAFDHAHCHQCLQPGHTAKECWM